MRILSGYVNDVTNDPKQCIAEEREPAHTDAKADICVGDSPNGTRQIRRHRSKLYLNSG